uniref:Acyltransferase 3 domain-containing protein n=1 Tax=Pyramimonas obovata TaxID=1411642 RepID=A0A7S0RR12_9CHLO|mmetsp:Transcript_4680/g.9512  ORF Transcript_4680/g.9512 Transcript_4680/m.9512 type:complete len:298 (+) Transcript_4680:793-1686(+)
MLKYLVYETPPKPSTVICFMANHNQSDENPWPWDTVLDNLLAPFYHMWYMWALVMWRFIIPYWMELRNPVVLSVAMAVFIPFIKSTLSALGMQRVFGYFPFFVVGVVMKQEGHSQLVIEFVSKWETKVWAVAMMGVHIMCMAYASLDRLCLTSVMFSLSIYEDFCARGWHKSRWPDWWEPQWAHGWWLQPFTRVPSIALCLVASLAFLALMPGPDNILRRAGERSLAPYIGHLVMLILLHCYTDLVEDLEWKRVVPTFVIMAAWTIFLFHPRTYSFLLNSLIPPLHQMSFVFKDKSR